MNRTPQPGTYRPAQDILALADFIADPVRPADFPKAQIRFRNDRWAADVGLDRLSDAEWVAHFARFEPLTDSLPEPLALRYHGHQFRSYNPEIGDGRGFLFAQLRDSEDRLLDLGTKGSGQTPYSRFGDGRLTLKGAVREILATEMLEALGVETSKTFSVIETGEALDRNDEPSPTRSAVLVRLNHSHLRIGSFQRLAAQRDAVSLRRLVDYAMPRYFGSDGGPVELLTNVVSRTSRLAGWFMAAGFVHGVLNSDNINITGESFDYGPWRWTPKFEAGFTAAYFDQSGLYAFGRQAEAIHWDVAQLAISLTLLVDQEPLVEALSAFPDGYHAGLAEAMLWRLGVASRGLEADLALVAALEKGLVGTQMSLDQCFFDWRCGSLRGPSPAETAYESDAFSDFRALVAMHTPAASLDHPYWSGDAPCSMLIDEVEAIWASIAESDDWSRLEAKVVAVRAMGEAYRS